MAKEALRKVVLILEHDCPLHPDHNHDIAKKVYFV